MKFSGRTNTVKDYNFYIKRLRQLSQNPITKVSGLISLTIFSIAFFGIFAILPTFKTIASLLKEIEGIKEVNLKMAQKIKTLTQAEEIYAQNLDDFPLISKVLPETAEFDRLTWQVEWLASQNQVNIPTASFGEFQVVGPEIVNKDGLGKIQAEVTIVGSYQQAKKFMEELETIDRLITINDVRITNKTLLGKNNNVVANIKFEAYYLPNLSEALKK